MPWRPEALVSREESDLGGHFQRRYRRLGQEKAAGGGSRPEFFSDQPSGRQIAPPPWYGQSLGVLLGCCLCLPSYLRKNGIKWGQVRENKKSRSLVS